MSGIEEKWKEYKLLLEQQDIPIDIIEKQYCRVFFFGALAGLCHGSDAELKTSMEEVRKVLGRLREEYINKNNEVVKQ